MPMPGATWISDRDAGMRAFFVDAFPRVEVVEPAELIARLRGGMRPQGLVIDGTQLLELTTRLRRAVVHLPRLLVCTGLSLVGLPPELHTRPNIVVLAKPFRIDDLEAALEWLTDAPVHLDPRLAPPPRTSLALAGSDPGHRAPRRTTAL